MRRGVVGQLADGLAIGRRGRLQNGTRFLRAALVQKGPPQAAEVPAAVRPPPPQILEDRDLLVPLALVSQSMGQLVGRLGAE